MQREDQNIWEPGSRGMTEYPDRLTNTTTQVGGMDIDIRRIFSIWPFIILFGLLGYAVGSIYLRYASVIYTVSTGLSIEEKQEVSLGQAFFGNPRDPFNDRVEYLKSPAVAAQLVDSLGLQYNADAQGRFRNKNFYKIIRWRFLLNPGEEVPEFKFTIIPRGDGFRYIWGKTEGKANWDQPFQLSKYKLVVTRLQPFNTQSPIVCYSTNSMVTAFALSRKINIATTKESNIISIKYSDVSSDRAVDILNGLVILCNTVLERDKSLGFSQAIDFIEQRMAPLRRELDSIETALAAFKSSKGLVGNSANGDLYLQKMQEYDKDLTKVNIMESTARSLEGFIRNPALKDADLSFVGAENPGLLSMLTQYQQMLQQKDKLSLTAQPTNPTMMVLDKSISDMRGNMEKQLSNYKSNLQIARNAYQQKISTASNIIRNIPVAERELIDKTRFQNIKEQLYLTLLQKREEAAIAKASVTVNTKILYPPVKVNASLSPSRSQILIISIFIGLLLPIIFAILKEIFNKKIISKKQLQAITDIPVLAELEQISNAANFPFVIEGSSRSMFGEQVRSLRTSLSFYLDPAKPCNYIILTSSVSGEGKSFLSMNIAKSFSLQGKRVAMLEFDLRRPKITKALGMAEPKIGLSSMLLGKQSPADIIIPVFDTEQEKLDLFPSGAIPPNPQELVSNPNMKVLKEYLDKNYDVVVVDTPPYGIVADAQILAAWADVSIIVTRFQQTVKEQVQEINEWQQRGLFKSMAIVFNGVRNSGYFGYKYGYYYYKRKYGYSYYTNDPEKKKKSS
jgi:capsular exopolysaccharide synthesis family protein